MRLLHTYCSDCCRLQSEYERLRREYAIRRGLLTADAETARASEYHRLRIASDEALIDAEIAGRELACHIKKCVRVN